ncbi:type I-E CRISPR-associated protein Cse2/CasB [Nocardiopsis sp. NPDC006938]|uniref:type I-E CRISPR-associated protein Cse2/CasB n=1 Tax=Nocardiopsis sp. NPDC006938 TaxID=3364337 RepID=UPI00368EF025
MIETKTQERERKKGWEKEPVTDRHVLRAADRMADHLEERVRNEPAVRAVLRRASGKRVDDPAVLPVHGFVARYLDRLLTSIEDDDRARWRFREADVERAFYGVAAMIAAQPRQARDRTGVETGVEDSESGQESTEESAGGSAGQTPQAASDLDQTASGTDQGTSGTDRDTPGTDTERRPADPLRRHSNLGAVLGDAVTRGRLNADTTEERLHLLCRQSVDGVHAQLPRLVLHACDKGVTLDWGRLALDLSRWGADRDTVAKEWVQSYHRTIETERARRDEARAQNDTDDDSEDHTA